MQLSAARIYSDIVLYGYTYPETGDVLYWSMKYYPETGYASMHYAKLNLLGLK